MGSSNYWWKTLYTPILSPYLGKSLETCPGMITLELWLKTSPHPAVRSGSKLKKLRRTMMMEHRTFKQREKHRKNIKNKKNLKRLLSLK